MPKRKKTITVRSCDDQVFEVDEDVATLSPILSLFFTDENLSTDPITFSRISGRVLRIVLKYCYFCIRFAQIMASNSVDPLAKQRFSRWEYDFINVVATDKELLFNLTKVANYLNIEGLMNLACKTIANFIQGKTSDQIRTVFTVKNRHYKEEDENIRMELGWLE